MTSSSSRLLQQIDNVKKLKDLARKVDPASGMTVGVRRGPNTDDNESPWITIETGENLGKILGAIIEAVEASISLNKSFVVGDIRDATAALAVHAEYVLVKDKKP